MIETAVDGWSAYFGLVVGVVKCGRRMASGNTNAVRIVGLRLNVGIEVRADENAGSGLVITPESSGVTGRRSCGVGTAASEDTLSNADIGIVGYGLAGDIIEWALIDASFGCRITPGILNGTAAIA